MAVKREHILKNHFDEQFDELFFYDIDLCLRSRCCVTDILVSHNKPKEYFGKYPEKMKPFGYYYDAFHNKHSLKPEMEGFQYCGGMLLKDYV